MALAAVVALRWTRLFPGRGHRQIRQRLESELLLRHYRRDKAIAAPAERLHDALGAATVTHGFANRHDAVVEGGIADELIRPDVLEQLLPGHDAVAMQNQKGERIEDARFERNKLAAPPHLTKTRIEFAIAECVFHRGSV